MRLHWTHIARASKRPLLHHRLAQAIRFSAIGLLVWSVPASAETAKPAPAALAPVTAPVNPPAGQMTRAIYLDRLMMAESGGRDDARNPRSTAVGPYQLIVGTFLYVTRRYFPEEVANLSDTELLAKRTDRTFSRRVADAYTNDCAAELVAAGLPATFPNLRLSYLLGPHGAIKVLRAPPDTPMAALVRPQVMIANPFLARLTASGLMARAARDIGLDPNGAPLPQVAVVPPPGGVAKPKAPQIPVNCDLGLPSCKRWLALARKRLSQGRAVASR